ncbi:MAG: PQQ-like beta-propeller repeat protein [Verrucomicrobia bacterium]|nr:PQQ-like beta-propeller repeat protein [Verrucomicrobiota bacterium]
MLPLPAKLHLRPLVLLLATPLLAPVLARAADVSSWPTWRGPAGTGVAPGAQPPLTWSDDKNIKWKTAIPGLGFSTPVVAQDRIFLLTAIETSEERPGAAPAAAPAEPAPAPGGDGGPRKGGRKGGPGGGFGGGGAPTKFHEFAVVAVERSTGKIVWQKTARREVPHEGKHQTNSFASGSPVTDGERLYVNFGSRGVYCYDLAGNQVWTKDLGRMRSRNSFGEGASPALAGPHLIVPWDNQENSFIVALDKKTGAEVWRQTRDEIQSWSTPLIVEGAGRQQAIIPASKRTRSYDTKTGELVWEASGLTSNVIPSPVTGHGLVYVMSGYQGNSIQAIKLTARGDISETDSIAWSARKSAPYVASPVLSGERLYMSKGTDAYLSCLNALTGEVHFQDQPLPGLRGMYASPLAANGHLYLTGRNGVVMVVKDASKFEVVATNTLSDPIDASPIALGRELFLRGHKYLYCISEG